MFEPEIEIHITTKNRWNELQFTLQQLQRQNVFEIAKVVVFDDGSTDQTSDLLLKTFPQVKLLRNEKSKGLIHCRNQMLNNCLAKFAVSLDDDAHFVTSDALQQIPSFFTNESVAVLAFRIFWGKELPANTQHTEVSEPVQSFVGCGHAWRISAWKMIENYPAWWKFYGEEDFAAYQLFTKKLIIQYVPDIFVQHRVDVKARKLQSDYQLRLRRAWRAGWSLMLLFYPWNAFFRAFAYSVYTQFKSRIFKSEPAAIKPMTLALFDFFTSVPRLLNSRKALSKSQYSDFQKLPAAKIYWQPNT